MSAGHIIYSTKLESSLNSISVTGKHRSSLWFLATITEISFLILTFCSIKQSRFGRLSKSLKFFTILTPLPS
jgi:hypothetical protein